jgi:hypothetical protein
MKSPALATLKVDPFVFAVYTSVGIFLVSVPLIVYLLVIDKFQFEFWAILGAADIVIVGTLVMFLSSFKKVVIVLVFEMSCFEMIAVIYFLSIYDGSIAMSVWHV